MEKYVALVEKMRIETGMNSYIRCYLNILNKGHTDFKISLDDTDEVLEFFEALEANNIDCVGQICKVYIDNNNLVSIEGMKTNKAWVRKN